MEKESLVTIVSYQKIINKLTHCVYPTAIRNHLVSVLTLLDSYNLELLTEIRILSQPDLTLPKLRVTK